MNKITKEEAVAIAKRELLFIIQKQIIALENQDVEKIKISDMKKILRTIEKLLEGEEMINKVNFENEFSQDIYLATKKF